MSPRGATPLPLPDISVADLAPGVYTIAFTVTDVQSRQTPFGCSGGAQPPGGPPAITVVED